MKKIVFLLLFLLLVNIDAYAQCSDIPVVEAVVNGDFELGYPKNGKFSDGTDVYLNSDLNYKGDYDSTTTDCWNTMGDSWAISKGELGINQPMCCPPDDDKYYSPYGSCSYQVGEFKDHTTNSPHGYALIADVWNKSASTVSRNGNLVIWEQQVSIYPGQTYYFSV